LQRGISAGCLNVEGALVKPWQIGKISFRRANRAWPIRAAAFALLAATSIAGPNSATPPPLSADMIVQKLMAANASRAEALRAYQGRRVYHLDYRGLWGIHWAEIQVDATYTAPDKKDFKIISESGSPLLINRVLLKLLSSEQEAQLQQNRKELEITPANYNFSLEQIQHTSAGDFYILNLTPKGKNKYLYRGKIWVDARDFAVVRMSGEPQKNPSLWVSHTQIEYHWAKQDGFWLPIHNQSVTDVRLGGRAFLTIDYSNYQITGVSHMAAGKHDDQSQTLPDPAAVTVNPH
jgi:hypothetical protein